MKKYSVIALVLTLILLLASCAENVNETSNGTGSSAIYQQTGLSTEAETTVQIKTEDPENTENRTESEFSLTDENGNEIEGINNVYTITSGGEYTAVGRLEEGQIVVSAPDDEKVTLSLAGVYITNSSSSPILVLTSDKTDIEAKNGTYNEIIDKRDNSSVDENDYDGAIYAECDLKISGKGTLIVSSTYDKGIKTNDDLKIANLTLKVQAVGNALKGSDSVTVESGTLILISEESDGVKTSNSSISSKNNQKGIITFSGGTTEIYSYSDGISAAYDVVITGEETVVSVYTGSYSDYAASSSSQSTEFYLILPTSAYSISNDYYIYAYNGTSGKYIQFTYDTMVSSGKTRYYGMKGKLPSDCTTIVVYTVAKGETPNDENYISVSDDITLNKNMNGILVSVSGETITGDFVNLSMNSGNGNKTTYSSKGIKAENEISISGGVVTVYATDDAIHANNDELENGNNGTGNIYISGGTIYITSSDDGIHSDNILEISGGKVYIKESHEGLEGNVINVKDGTLVINADDDGINAFKGSSTPAINISGGVIDVTVPTGDTDGIDSNGNITITGGFTVVRSGSSMGGMAGSVDLDGTLKVTGGTIVAIGGICETPASGSVCTYISSNTSLSAGTYTLVDSSNNTLATFELSTSYSSIWLSSSSITVGNSYKLQRSGTTVLEWTQNQTTVGSSSSGGGWSFPGRR